MYSLLFSVLKVVPLWILSALARLLSWVLGFFQNSSLYRTININLMLVNPTQSEDKRKTLLKKILYNQLNNTLISAKVWVMPSDWAIAQISQVHNQHLLTNALKNPNGMLAIVPHIGAWEMMNAWLNGFGSPTIMYKPLKNNEVDSIVRQGRERLNATLVPTDGTGVKAIFKTLKDGGFSIILPDHVPDKNGGVVVPFFGVPTLTGTLTAKLASKTHCSLVGLACVQKDDGFHIFCYDLTDKNLYHKDTIIATSALNTAMQMMITEHFDEYMWGYRRFKHTPIAENLYLLDFDTILQKRLAMTTNHLGNHHD